MKSATLLVALACVFLVCAGCTWTDTASDFNGLGDHGGHMVKHYNQTKLACNLLFTTPLWGDATLNANVDDLTSEVKSDGGKAVRIVQSDDSLWWWVFPPFSFILTPATSNVALDAAQ